MGGPGGVKRKIKVSKNKKKSWSKFSDIKEVEEFLEEKRFEDRIGGPVSEKPNEELFFVQTGNEEPAQAKKKIPKTLKCHQYIGSYSSVPAPVNVDIERYPKRIKSVLQKATDKAFKKLCSQGLKRNKPSEEDSQCGNSTSTLRDLWADEKEVDDEIKDLIIFRDEYTEKRTPNVPSHRFQKPSLLPAVEVPHAGASYNPTYNDHQALLLEAVKVEEKHEKDELHIKRVLNKMFPTVDKAPTQESILHEMSQGLFEEEEEDEEEDDDAEPTSNSLLRNPPVSADNRLTKQRHRKRKELKEKARLRTLEKLHKRRLHEIYRLPSIKSELLKEQEVSKKRQNKKLDRKIDQMYNPKTLSKHKYEAPNIEVNLTEEITGSLRTLKTDGNLLEDRYKSLQRRNIIEPRIKQRMKRKYKLKKQIKRSHRDFV